MTAKNLLGRNVVVSHQARITRKSPCKYPSEDRLDASRLRDPPGETKMLTKNSDLSHDTANVSSESSCKCSINLDMCLDDLMDVNGIDTHDEQILVCDVLYDLGLVRRRIFSEEPGEPAFQNSHYTSTKKLQKLMGLEMTRTSKKYSKYRIALSR
jgi:hypothetical protein